ncbi:MAG: DUF4010 domain-containing protein [Bdellovibrionaceae bacterium]|nr:DUF4010 domain-containing protein [Pseudobdellovibrionaceae bacterium]
MLASLLGPVVAVVLISKAPLHRFTSRLKASEIEAALLLLLFGVSLLNLVEDRVIDPWGIFNPYKFGLLVLILATLEFASYALTKMLGVKSSTLLIGFFGGLVSSTAVLLSNSRQALKVESAWRPLLAAVMAATLGSLAELLFIVGFVSRPLLLQILFPVSATILVGGASLAFLMMKKSECTSEIQLKSPLDWKGVIRLALLLAAILAGIAVVKLWLGENATLVVSTLTAMLELHGVSLANSTMFARGQLQMSTAINSLLLACTASLVAKTAISWMINRGPFSRALSLIHIAMAAALWISA